METKTNQEESKRVIIQNKKQFLESLPRIVRSARRHCKEEIRAIKTEMFYAKQDYNKRIAYLKDRIQTEKDKVALAKIKAKEKNYEAYVAEKKDILREYEIVIDSEEVK